MGTQQYLTSHRYQMKIITLFYEKKWKQQAVKALRIGKSAGVDNTPAELVQAGGDILISICSKIWKTGNVRPHGLNP